ncbi:MAG: excinuclease ABC subunit UvrC [Bacteroidales bacterium]|nr:excinuclease ABC subunit UvrC [Bacteroidales bacterium]
MKTSLSPAEISLLPHSPGVYRYYDAEGTVIYVGKAKDLHKRVAQYFVAPERLNAKTRVLVSRIDSIQYSVVDSESDALLLENNLIKQFKPRYNILLKDSKTYPWICVTSEPFPRVFLTRRVDRNGAGYFGPYSSVLHARRLLEVFRSAYPIRSCKHKITSETILRHKSRPCLDMHIGLCRGCCVGGVSQEEYGGWIEDIVRILKGGTAEIIAKNQRAMQDASDGLDFETAQVCKERIAALQQHYSRSVVSSARDIFADVFALEFDGMEAFGNFLRVKAGAVVQSLNLGFRMAIEETRESVLSAFLAEIESKFGELQPTVIVPFLPDVEIEGVNFRMPVRGEKLELLELSAKNAREARLGALKQREHSNPDEFYAGVLEDLRKALGMEVLPEHMECFDNSNIQGTNPVGACVVFRGGRPSKGEYRKFKIRTVVGANDYATMKEVVNRRYSRMLEEAPDDLPQLVVIDGGKGQLSMAYEALFELGLTDRLTVVGLAERFEEVVRVGDPYPLFIDRNSRALKVLQHIRDEAHRFGITFHRDLRSKEQVRSALRSVKGVGEQTEQRILLHYGSVARMLAAGEKDLAGVVGPVLAGRIIEKLNNTE